MKIIILFLMIALFYSCSKQDEGSKNKSYDLAFHDYTYDEALTLAASQNFHILLDFYSDT